MTEYERKQQEIASKLIEQGFFQQPNYVKINHIGMAKLILSLVEIRADDQTTPDIEPPKQQSIIGEVNVFTQSFIRKRTAYLEGEMDMLKAGFVKVAPKPNV